MKQNLKVIIGILIIFIGFGSKFCLSKEIDVDLFGFSYHFDKQGAFKDAPNGLDKAGKWVFNPGFGLGYDFRKDIHTEGFSVISQLGFFQNCANSPFGYDGAGIRYRKFIFKKFFWETNGLGLMTYGQDWDENSPHFAIVPYVNTGFGYDFGKKLVTVSVSYIPQNSGATITNGTDLLFFNMTISF